MLIPLTRGQCAIIDDEDLPLLGPNKWQAQWCKRGRRYYATQSYVDGSGIRQFRLMHRVILGVESSFFVDHQNRDGLDNRRSNLRIATQSQNQANSVVKPGKCGYRGVRPSSGSGWRAVITKDQKRIFLGAYETKEEAALAYNIAAKDIYGEFATLNDIQGDGVPVTRVQRRSSTSKGVSYSTTRNRWRSYRKGSGGNRIHVGWYRTEAEAVFSLQAIKQEYAQ